jgi:hypothetical protein
MCISERMMKEIVCHCEEQAKLTEDAYTDRVEIKHFSKLSGESYYS